MNVLMVGVGGQGVLTCADILARAAIECGFDVKVSEVHGMAQRGGSVYSHVRYSERVDSPLIMQGEADVIVAFERVESLRFAQYAKPNGLFIVNNQRLDPVTVSSGQSAYPDDVFDRLKALPQKVWVMDGEKLAASPETRRSVNFLLLGALSAHASDIRTEVWEKVIRDAFRKKAAALKIILKVFREGKASVGDSTPDQKHA
ncbi:MAG: indolepyruvate oxidoreductase subunit beta [Candidatus Abyssobacteria bacterium SURF_17]|uniref:Indolepyruvate oxidoreductase subunit beta n=1 Tax=Candidatus Abyssobacteria bacterium SURF_17 TaxID=2093361 RepID=A0A419F6S7_9BACT|nr:MAG: indolepyruvate oxidoreductase subunit beta [Candidatus Abyssubacteria bacterium SURF_17]